MSVVGDLGGGFGSPTHEQADMGHWQMCWAPAAGKEGNSQHRTWTRASRCMPELEFCFVNRTYAFMETRLETFGKICKGTEMVSWFTWIYFIKQILNAANPRVFCLFQRKLYFVGYEDLRIWREADDFDYLVESSKQWRKKSHAKQICLSKGERFFWFRLSHDLWLLFWRTLKSVHVVCGFSLEAEQVCL